MGESQRERAKANIAAAIRYGMALAGEVQAPIGDNLENFYPDFGHYDGLPPQIELLGDGRDARLVSPISYIGANGSEWPVPIGAALDGASIPRAFWTVMGGPFEGKYRDASIVHDYYCDEKSRNWRNTHRMFHQAMRCSGVPETKAAIMYYAVRQFGPRWPDNALERTVPRPLPLVDGETDVEFLLSDLEAIVVHGLTPDAIDALADTRESRRTSALEGERPSRDAEMLVIPGGNGTVEDAEAVMRHADALPPYVLRHFADRQIRIVACRGSVTDFETGLRGKIPRGWEATGKTWDDVPGTYFDDRKRVVIATEERGGARAVPGKTSGLHGSDDLVVHEALHGFDYSGGHAVLRTPEFNAARDQDMAGLDAYERQPGQAGLEETFAETGAQHCASPSRLQARCVHLSGYWTSGAPAHHAGGKALPLERLGGEPARTALGTATRNMDRSITFDLRAEGDGGAIGHAMFEIVPGDPRHAPLEGKLFAANSGPLEGVKEQVVPYFGVSLSRSDGMKIDPISIIDAADVGYAGPVFERTDTEASINIDKLPEGVVSGSTLIDFSAAPSPVIRSSVSLAMLFASRVATTAMKPGDDEDDWLALYTQKLGEVGFRISGFSMVTSKFKKTEVSVHQAIIPFLTIAFGGGAVGPIILQGLKSLQETDANDPWITLFDRSTRRFNAREMHFAAVSANDVETSIRYAVVRLNAESSETKVLFVRVTKGTAEFESATTTMTADNSLLASVEARLRAKLQALIETSIDGADIG